jgi:hypothetical protein
MAGSPRRRKIVAKFRKKPVVIEAVQWAGDNLSEIQKFYKPESFLVGDQIWINTLEGTMKADVGDWIIKGIKGEFYPCKPYIFALTYEPAEVPPDRDDGAKSDAAMREGVRDEKVKGLIGAAKSGLKTLLEYADADDAAGLNGMGCYSEPLLVIGATVDLLRSALAEVEKPEVDAEVTKREVEKSA